MTDLAALADALARPGSHAVPFVDEAGHREGPITLNCYRAAGYDPAREPVFVQHGMLRNGDDYRDFWIEAADRHGLLVVAPTFSNEHYPEPESYNNGRVLDVEGSVRPREEWAYGSLARIFAALRAAGVTRATTARLFGHSAGGQFVHRLAALEPGVPFGEMIASNAGWYTLPLLDKPFPEGLGGIGLDEDDLRRLFALPLVILAGAGDVATDDPHLPSNPEALAQGPHRFARAGNYIAVARREAERLGVPLAWRLVEVAHIGHDGRAMSAVAARLWYVGAIPEEAELAALAGQRAA
ncbi:MAG: alpha/beta hydrolase [Salinarimonas sp.]